MIFSKVNHIQKIIAGIKTQTRRPSDRYQVGRTYAVQPGRGKHGIPDGRILILEKRYERYGRDRISEEDAWAEGGYGVSEYELLYLCMHPDWIRRVAYTFKFIPTEASP